VKIVLGGHKCPDKKIFDARAQLFCGTFWPERKIPESERKSSMIFFRTAATLQKIENQ
jgi:hypothetical protein